MITLKQYLTEALVNKDINKAQAEFNKEWSKVTFKDITSEIEKSFKEAGLDNVSAYNKDGLAEYTIVLGHKPSKGKFDNGARLGVNLVLTEGKGKLVNVYLKLAWSNGKMSYSVMSNVSKSKRYEFEFDNKSSHTLFKSSVGGHDYYSCTPDVANHIIDGIKKFKYYKGDFEDAMKKARFSDQQWDKLVDKFDDMFGDKWMSIDKTLPWNVETK